MATLPTDAAERKRTPIYSGVLRYFPLALAEVAKVSVAGNEQHNPGAPLHWDRAKSGDELDAATRHMLDAGKVDTDGQRHLAKACWRLLAALQKELEAEAKLPRVNMTYMDPASVQFFSQSVLDELYQKADRSP